jgi:hypothetical protein
MSDPVRDSQERWRRERHFLNARRYELSRAVAQRLYPPSWRVTGTSLLARREWIPATPVPLDQVTLVRRADEPGRPVLDGTGPESAAVRPLRDDGGRRCWRTARATGSSPSVHRPAQSAWSSVRAVTST